MLLSDVLVEESVDQFLLGCRAQVAVDALVLLLKALIGPIQVGSAGAVSDELIAFEPEVVRSLGEQD